MRKLLFGALLVCGLLLAAGRVGEASHLMETHWAATGEVRVGILFRGSDTARQTTADAAKAWSDALPFLEMGIVGEASAEICDVANRPRDYPESKGFIVVCAGEGNPYLVSATGSTTIRTECEWVASSDCAHTYLAQVHTRDVNPLLRTVCHELGHAIGLWHGGDGCMSSSTSCPGSTDAAHLAPVYAHDDGYTSAASVGDWTVAGVNRCVPVVSPTPTPTAEPTPTPSPTAPVPCRLRGNSGKCK